MATIGEVKDIKNEHEIEWKIVNFSSLSVDNSVWFVSPNFSLCNESWCLQLYPNCFFPTGYIGLLLQRKSPGPPIKIVYTLGLKTLSGQRERVFNYEYTFINPEETSGYWDFLSRSELFEKKEYLLPNDVIRFCCSLKLPMSEEILEDGSLSEDLKKVLLDGCNHDLILKVGDEEFKAHQDILSARSEVFKRMLKYDMTEKNSGIIDISDCDPDAMKVFLSYIYSGKVENLDQSNAIGLYYIADKYDMKILKEKSSDFIKKSVSSINICEVIQLALNHSDSSLLDFATEFFLNNVLEILRTVEWQYFMKNNSTVANELIIKSHEKKK